MKLVQIQPEAVLTGQPLPYALRTEDGALLANKGFVIQSRPELDRLRDTRPIFIDTQTLISRSAAVRLNALLDQDTTLGASCFAELRTVETLRDGKPSTPFMKFGDIVRIEVLDRAGNSVFGAIEQRIEQQPTPR